MLFMSTSSKQKNRFIEAEQQLKHRKDENTELKSQYSILTAEITQVRKTIAASVHKFSDENDYDDLVGDCQSELL